MAEELAMELDERMVEPSSAMDLDVSLVEEMAVVKDWMMVLEWEQM